MPVVNNWEMDFPQSIYICISCQIVSGVYDLGCMTDATKKARSHISKAEKESKLKDN